MDTVNKSVQKGEKMASGKKNQTLEKRMKAMEKKQGELEKRLREIDEKLKEVERRPTLSMHSTRGST